MKAVNNIAFRVIVLVTFVSTTYLHAQQDSTAKDTRQKILIATSAVGYTGAYVGFYQLWYKNSPKQSFRFFNDNAEWKQVDKVGHFYSAFYFTWATSRSFQWAGASPNRADLIGAITGFLVLAPIEIFDGYSADYGASAGDLVADAVGPLFFLGQKKLWNEIRIIPKFSYQPTGFAQVRPELLGDNSMSRVFKDYNGQTYWLSLDVDKFTRFPKWLNIAVGYGANGMVYARDGQNEYIGLKPGREYYLSLDFDLSAIRSRSKLIKTLVFVANTIKLPSPALKLSRQRVSFDAFTF